MSDWTKRDQARVDFLNACVAVYRALDANEVVDTVTPASAWEKYRDLIDGKEENLTLDENRWFCPHCGAERPGFGFHFVGTAVMGIGAVQYFNVFCSNESCRKLITVMLAGFIPEAELIARAKAQMGAQRPGHA